MLWSLLIQLVEKLIGGEAATWLANRRAARSAYRSSNEPLNKRELETVLKDHDL